MALRSVNHGVAPSLTIIAESLICVEQQDAIRGNDPNNHD
jgi:hypothetical protein